MSEPTETEAELIARGLTPGPALTAFATRVDAVMADRDAGKIDAEGAASVVAVAATEYGRAMVAGDS